MGTCNSYSAMYYIVILQVGLFCMHVMFALSDLPKLSGCGEPVRALQEIPSASCTFFQKALEP